MPVRKKFKPAEREAFTPGAEVEWLNGSTWRTGVIRPGATIQTDSIGLQYIEITDTGKATRTITPGGMIWGSPGHLRLAK